MTTEDSKVIDRISVSDLVRKCFSAYELKDRRIIEDLLSDDFTFTSPLDDRINRGFIIMNKLEGKVALVTGGTSGIGLATAKRKAVVFLASDDSSFVNGIELFVDGGMAQI